MTPEERANEARAFAAGQLEQEGEDRKGELASRMEATDAPLSGGTKGGNVPFVQSDLWAAVRRASTRDSVPQAPQGPQVPYVPGTNKYEDVDAANEARGATPSGPDPFDYAHKTQAPDPSPYAVSGSMDGAPAPAAPTGVPGPDVQGPSGGAAGQPAPAAPQGYFRPGTGFRPTSRQIQSGVQGPEVDTARAEYSAATGLGLKGVDHQVSAEQQRLDAAKAIAQRDYMAGAITQARQTDLANRKKQAEDDGYSQIQALTQEVREGAIDPNHMWAERGTAARIFATIGVAMGAFVAAKTGGPNLVLQQVNGEIDRDIDAQKANLAGKSRSLEHSKSLLAMNLARFGNEEQAILASRAMAKEQAAKEFDVLTAGSKDQDLLANAAKLKSTILNSAGDDMTKLAQLAGDKVTTAEAYDRGGRVGGDAGGGNPKAPDNLFVPTGPNGEGYRARTEKEAQKGRSLRAAVSSLENVVNQGVSIRKKTNLVERAAGKSGLHETEDFSKLESLGDQAVGAVKEAEELGALDIGSATLSKGIVGDFSSVRGNPDARAQSYLNNVRKKLTDFEKAQGGQGANQAFRRDADGNVYTRSIGDTTMASPSPGMPAMTTVSGQKLPGARPAAQVRAHDNNDGHAIFSDDPSIPSDPKPAKGVKAGGIKPKHRGRK